MRREILKGKKEIEENSLIQKRIIERINGTKENEWSNCKVRESHNPTVFLNSTIK